MRKQHPARRSVLTPARKPGLALPVRVGAFLALSLTVALATRTTYTEGLGYLVLYNAIFILPLVAMLALASSRKVFNTLGRWQLQPP